MDWGNVLPSSNVALSRISKKSNNQLLRDLTEQEDAHEIQEFEKILKECCIDKQNVNDKYTLSKMSEINNKELSSIYYKHFKEANADYKKYNCKSKKLKPQQRRLFYLSTDEEEVKDIVKNGFKCRETSSELDNLLGQNKNGIHFCKNIDMLLHYMYSSHTTSFFVILVELIVTNITVVAQTPVSPSVDPSPDSNLVTALAFPDDFGINLPEERYKTSLVT
jgi:hypothetical protein